MRVLAYGQVRLFAAECPNCKRESFANAMKTRILRSQHWRCLYCDIGLFVPIYRNGKQVRRSICFDHFVPWSYSQDNRVSNIAACCSVCNGLKSWLMFKDLDECRDYIAARWQAKGYSRTGFDHTVPGLQDAI